MAKSFSKNHIGKNSPSWKGGKVKRICKQCGKEFEVGQSIVKRGKGKYCSHRCAFDSKIVKRNKITCRKCGKIFEVTDKVISAGKQYCSKKCYNEDMSSRFSGVNNPNHKYDLEKECEICGTKFNPTMKQIKNGWGKYCSSKCYGKYRSTHFCGENHPQWTGGPKEYCIKFNKDLKNRIIAFWFENNKNICPLCEKPFDNKTPHCHHSYYDKKACCLISDDGKYFSNLGIKGSEKTFEIIGNPNKFVPMHSKCHLKTNNKSKRVFYARKFETTINEKFDGKSYYTKEEYKKFLIRHPEWSPPYK
jgi:hypothetical protein